MYILTHQATKTHNEMLFFALNLFGSLSAWWERNPVTLVYVTKIHYWNRKRVDFFFR